MRIELTTSSLPRKCSTTELQRQTFICRISKINLIHLFSLIKNCQELNSTTLSFYNVLSGRRGSNPRPTAWKAVALPTELLPHSINITLCLVGREGFEPSKLSQRIYSPSHLATLVSPRFLSLLPDLNQRPTDYKSVALPAELRRRHFCIKEQSLKHRSFLRTAKVSLF